MSSQYAPILLLVALLFLFWVVVLRPARRAQNATAEIQRNLAVGDHVVLSAGVFGTIVGIDEERVQLEVAPATVIQVARRVVVRRVDEDLSDPDDGPNENRPQAG
ncbi:MAG: preprotein translocase subunit YajC [Marmoricola sp.]